MASQRFSAPLPEWEAQSVTIGGAGQLHPVASGRGACLVSVTDDFHGSEQLYLRVTMRTAGTIVIPRLISPCVFGVRGDEWRIEAFHENYIHQFTPRVSVTVDVDNGQPRRPVPCDLFDGDVIPPGYDLAKVQCLQQSRINQVTYNANTTLAEANASGCRFVEFGYVRVWLQL